MNAVIFALNLNGGLLNLNLPFILILKNYYTLGEHFVEKYIKMA